ncbi:hypothetical protein ACFE04_001196 [Oxalis oulophora]
MSLSPQNIEKLFEQVKLVNINNVITLIGVISQIFDKTLTDEGLLDEFLHIVNGAVEVNDCVMDVQQQGDKEFMVEIEMLSRLHHHNLVKLADYYSGHDSSQDLLCYELISNGSLESCLHGPLGANYPIDWDNIMKITLGFARGFASQSYVIHGDFKERVKILENTSHLPLAYITALVHKLHGVVETLVVELGDNVPHVSEGKVQSLMNPQTPNISSSD